MGEKCKCEKVHNPVRECVKYELVAECMLGNSSRQLLQQSRKFPVDASFSISRGAVFTKCAQRLRAHGGKPVVPLWNH